MQRTSTRPVQQQRAALGYFRMPSEVLRFDPREWQVFQPGQGSVICVDDTSNPPEVLDDRSAQLQATPEFLLKGVPLALRWRERPGPIQQYP
jgi:hypothetical protein